MRSVGLVAGVLGLVLVGCERAPPGTARSPNLSSADVHGSARLTAAERTEHIGTCVGLKDKFLRSPQAKRAKPMTQEKFEAGVDRVCECLINAVEDRASKMQFLMVVSSFGHIRDVLVQGKEPHRLSGFRRAAAKHGMSAADFDRARHEAGVIANASIQRCGRSARVT